MTEPATIPPSELLASLRQNTSDKVLALASHAALPVVVDAGFLNLLRVNFFLDPPDELPFEAEADLLLSPLCREIGDELYELDPAVRNLLLIMLQTRYGAERVRQVALLLEQYTQSTPTWTAQPELEQAQQLTALSFVDPARAQAWLDDAQTGRRTERLSHDWHVAMRARLAARPSATAAQDELAAAIAALDDESARIRLGAVNTLAVLSQLPGTDLTQVIDALARMLRSRANSQVERTGRDVQAALTLIGTLPREERPIDLSGIWLTGADLRNLNLSHSRLVNASFFDCQADGISLVGTDLYSADLVDMTANGASLRGAVLTAARLRRVSLRGASLAGSWLDGALLNDVDFSDANLSDASIPMSVNNLVQRGVNFSGANLASARFPVDSPDSPETSPTPTGSPTREQRADDLYERAERLEPSGNLEDA
ncbi:MAG TPA: pentapeptide repeat-containing protein, partial [Streptosporangiaceae bacterium]|nr:pentapeptide repeat-containing protein [Streptosporangiaceae bacterium]